MLVLLLLRLNFLALQSFELSVLDECYSKKKQPCALRFSHKCDNFVTFWCSSEHDTVIVATIWQH